MYISSPSIDRDIDASISRLYARFISMKAWSEGNHVSAGYLIKETGSRYAITQRARSVDLERSLTKERSMTEDYDVVQWQDCCEGIQGRIFQINFAILTPVFFTWTQ